MDEDDFPTFIDVVSNARRALKQEPLVFEYPWNSAIEHWAFAMSMETRTAPESWRTYELSKIHYEQLQDTDLKILP